MGTAITVDAKGKFIVPDDPIIPCIAGDGIGPDIWNAGKPVLDCAVAKAYGGRRHIEWLPVRAGEDCWKETGEFVPEATKEAITKYRVAIKGPLSTPVGKGFRSVNVMLRQMYDLYACVRPVSHIPGVPSPVIHPDDVNMVIFRENTEDLYAGVEWDHDTMAFRNMGDNPVMLRPRQDVELLLPADSFAWNLLRSYIVMVSILALVAALGIFLGAGLSRPVAMFVAFVALIVVEMGPSVAEQYPDSLETDAVDRFGLAIVRAVGACAKPPSALSPLSRLASDDCVEAKDALGTFAADFLLAPAVLSLLSAFVMRRKTQD